MLLRLLPEQIAGHWDYIKFGIENSVPRDILRRGDKLNNILESLLSSGMQCWWWVRDVDSDDPKVIAQVITTIYNDACSRTKTLRIYSLFGYENITPAEFVEGQGTLISYGKFMGCEELDAHTEDEQVCNLAKAHGFEQRFYWITRRL